MSTSHVDLEQGSMISLPCQSSESGDDDEDIRSICFSDADEDSTLYSTAGGSHDDDGDISESRRDSSASDCSVFIEILREDGLLKVHLDDDDEDEVADELRECRICHLSLGIGIGVIELGCACKNDLALAHSTCAERWFKIRGDRVCEICNSTAENVNVAIELELELMQHSNAMTSATIVTAQVVPASSVARPDTTRSFCGGHPFLNSVLACMVFAFVIYWLFHFNMNDRNNVSVL